MKEQVKNMLENYLQYLEQENKEFREKYRKEKPGDCGFHYDHEKMKSMTYEEHKNIRTNSEQRLHIKRLLKLMGE